MLIVVGIALVIYPILILLDYLPSQHPLGSYILGFIGLVSSLMGFIKIKNKEDIATKVVTNKIAKNNSNIAEMSGNGNTFNTGDGNTFNKIEKFFEAPKENKSIEIEGVQQKILEMLMEHPKYGLSFILIEELIPELVSNNRIFEYHVNKLMHHKYVKRADNILFITDDGIEYLHKTMQ